MNKTRLNSIIGCLEREIMRFLNEPIQTIFNVVFSNIIFIITLYFLSPSQINFIIPGMFTYIIFNIVSSNTRMTIFIGKLEQVLYYQLAAPISRLDLYITYLIANILRVIVTVFFIAVFTIIFFYRQPINNIFLFFILFICTTITFTNIGIVISLFYKNWNSVGAIENYLLSPLLYLSGGFFSLRYVPKFLYPIFYMNPFFHFSNVLRYSFSGIHELNITISLFFCVVTFLASIISCVIIFKSGYKLME